MDRKRVFPVLFPFSVGWLVACLITERVQDCLPVTRLWRNDHLFKDNGGRERGVEGRDGALRRQRSKRVFSVLFSFSSP